MRKVGVIFVAVWLALAVSSHTARAGGKPSTHSAKAAYSTPAVGVAGTGGGQCGEGLGCVEFATKKSDRSVTITITDSSGQPVFASVTQDKVTGDDQVHQTVAVGDICGKTTKPLLIEGGYPVDVFIWEGGGFDPPCTGVATNGTVKATFRTA